MRSNKFIEIFYRLSAAEKIAFKKWVHSPAFNKQEAVVRLFDFLYGLHPVKDAQVLDRQVLFPIAFPDAPFHLPQLRYVLADLMHLLEAFLVYRRRQHKELDFKLELAAAYRAMHLEAPAKEALAAAKHLFDQQSLHDMEYLEQAYRLQWMTYTLQEQGDRAEAQNLQALNDSFDLAYLVGKLKHACRVLSYQGMFSKQYDLGLLNPVLEYLEAKSELLKEPALALYFYYYQVMTRPEEAVAAFAKFKQQLFEYQSAFSISETRDLYILAINYCIKRLNTDDQAFYLQETFDLYKGALEQGVLLEKGQLSPFAFSNIVAVALGLGLEDWTDIFITEYSPKLDEKWRRAQTDYNRSRWHFQRKAYRKAADLLVADDFDDLHLNLSAKVLLLKIYYHLQEIQLLDHLIRRFKTFLSRKKILNYHQENYHNILRLMQRLVDVNPYSTKDKTKLRREVEKTELLTEMAWFLDQLNGDLKI